MKNFVLILLLSLIITISNIGLVSANSQFNGNYSSKFQFRMGPSSVCPRTLPIEIDLQIIDRKIVGSIKNNGGGNTHQFCKLYHNGSIKGSIDYEGKIISLLVKQKDFHSLTFSSYEIKGNIEEGLSLLSRNEFFHPIHKFNLKKIKPANNSNKSINEKNDVEAKIFVSINNGTDLNYKNTEYINATVYFNDMMIDGTSHGNPSLRFKVERSPGQSARYSLILSSRKTYLPITKNNNRGGGQGMDGYKYWLTIGRPFLLSTLARDFNERQTKALKSMCGFLSSRASFEINVIPFIEQRKKGMKKSVAGLANKQAYGQWAQLAKMCKNALNQKVKGYETVSLESLKKDNTNKKLCGLETFGINLDTTTFKLMQEKLKKLDFYESNIDGLFGAGSCQALKKYLTEKNRLDGAKFTKLTLGMLIKDARNKDITLDQKKAVTSDPVVAEVKEPVAALVRELEVAKVEDPVVAEVKEPVAALVRELEVAKVEDPVVAAPIECSIESIETCTTEQICENAIEVIYGISSYKRGEDKFVESVKKDEIKCNYPNVLDDIPPKLLVEYLERFIEENGNIFDLDLIIKLQSLRDLFDLEKPAKNTQAHIEFVGYLKPYSEFENFAVDLERIYKSKKQEELALMTNQLADKVKSLKEWAQNNIMDPKAIEVVNFIKLFEENDKLSIDKASELTLMVAKLNELIYESKPQLEETKNTEDVLEDSAVENQNSSKELLSFPTISSFEIIQFTKEFGDGFDNFSAPKNFALALIKVKLDNIVSGEEFDAENIILLSSSGQTYEVNLSAIQAWAAQMGEAIPVSTKKLYVSDGFVDLVFMVKLSDKSNAEFKLSGAEVPSK
ncbi:hypothetical protein OAC76_03835 [Amylibacter sp.]|nr:hypothetical protein [Amylibacter sp.]